MSAANRISAFNFCDPFDHVLPVADGTVSAADRAHLWGLYSGIAVADIIVGPYCAVAHEVYTAGGVARETFGPGADRAQVSQPGATAAQVVC